MKIGKSATASILFSVLLFTSLSIGFVSGNLKNSSSVHIMSTATYPVVDTSQVKFYDNSGEIAAPMSGASFYGQDAQYKGNSPSYILSIDGLTVYDNVTTLTWQRAPNSNGNPPTTGDKLNWTQAQARPAALNAINYGGYSDWRLPTIKELYSLILFNGTDVSSSTSSGSATPFVDVNFFKFTYGNASAGERLIDAQYWSSTSYVSTTMNGNPTQFGVNFADGRIKGYPRYTGPNGVFTAFLICVRGNPDYGINQFVDNGDGTIMDNSTGLMWAQSDSGTGMSWQDALAWAQTKNAANYLGHSDWRLPNAKELQSIVDYTRSPEANSSAAIDPLFKATSITNEAGQDDYPFYWAGTTHVGATNDDGEAVYFAFGRAMGYISGSWIDVHGAGAQRSDPKSGNSSSYPNGRGPQGDAIRINNYVRLVRGGVSEQVSGAKSESSTPYILLAISFIALVVVVVYFKKRARNNRLT